MTSLWTIRYILSPFMSVHGYITRRKDGSLNRWLAESLNPAISPNATPVDGVATFDVVVDSSTGVSMRFFVPTQDSLTQDAGHKEDAGTMIPIVLYFHGGGFVLSRPDDALYDKFCRRMAKRCRVVVVSVHYRRAPEHKFPVAYDDCYAALEWLNSEQAKPLLPPNADLSRTFLCGDSAGGNIVHHVAVQASGKSLGLRGLVMMQPFFGGEERTPAEEKPSLVISVEVLDWFWKAYLPDGANRDHPASHVFGSRLPNVEIPPVLVVVGGRDILEDWDRRYVEEMTKAGKQVQMCFYEEAVHCFGQLNQAVIADQMLVDVATFFQKHQN